MLSEILEAPMALPSEKDLSNSAYADGPYHMRCIRHSGMPDSVKRENGITRNLGDGELSEEQKQKVQKFIEIQSYLHKDHPCIKRSDVFINFIKKELKGKPLSMSFLQQGSEIMSCCPVKAEFWLLHLPIPVRDNLGSLVEKLCTTPRSPHNGISISNMQTAGLTLPFRFMGGGCSELFNHTIGLMNIEASKMRWKSTDSDAKKSHTVVEISVFTSSQQLFSEEGEIKSPFNGADAVDIQFQTDFGQYVEPSTSAFKKLKPEEIQQLLRIYGFRSHILDSLSINGAHLLRMTFGKKAYPVAKLSKIFGITVEEVKRLQNTVKMLMRRATPERYMKAEAAGKKLRKKKNCVNIEFLPYYKPVETRFNAALNLEAEIRATAEGIINAIQDTTTKHVMETGGESKRWSEVFDKEVAKEIDEEIDE